MSWLTGREGARQGEDMVLVPVMASSHPFLPKPINININDGNSNVRSNGIGFGDGSNNNVVNNGIGNGSGFEFEIDRVEAQIMKVQAEKERIEADIKGDEVKIEALNREIKDYEQQLKALEHKLRDGCTLLQLNSMEEIERQKQLVQQRLHNLISYESTLILTTSSRGELLRALDRDLVQLYGQRKELRQPGGHKDVVSLDHTDLERVEQRHASSSETRSRLQNSGKLVIEGMTNVSISSGISSGDDENREFIHNSNKRDNEKVQDIENYDFEGAVEEAHPLRKLKVRRMDMQDTSLIPQHDDFDAGKKKKATKRTNRVTYRHLARRLTVDFDEKGNPVGPNAAGFKRSINTYVCHFMPINFKQIGDVPVEDYKAVLNVLMERFNFDLNKSYTKKKISSCYRQHKYKLMSQVKKDIERGIEPERPSYVKQEDWDAFVAKTKDEEFEKISNKNKANRSQQSGGRRSGRPVRPGRKRKPKADSGKGPMVEDAWTKALAFNQNTISPSYSLSLVQTPQNNA